MKEPFIIGLDIGGTNIRIGAKQARADGLCAHKKVPTETVLNGSGVIEPLAVFIEDFARDCLGGGTVEAVSIGFPATVNKAKTTVLQAPNIPGLSEVAITEPLGKRLAAKVFIEKDVNLLIKWDMHRLGIPGDGICVGIYAGTGIGNAIVLNGTPLAGKDGVAGELGHIPVVGLASTCGCGNKGCAECCAAGVRLRAIGQSHFPDTGIAELFSKHAEAPVIRQFIDALACVIAAEINILNPDCIVLGGGVVNMANFPKDVLNELIFAHARKPYPAMSLHIVYADDSAENGVLGAVLLAEEKLTEEGSI